MARTVRQKSRRLKDMEMILRFFAFYYCSNQYHSR